MEQTTNPFPSSEGADTHAGKKVAKILGVLLVVLAAIAAVWYVMMFAGKKSADISEQKPASSKESEVSPSAGMAIGGIDLNDVSKDLDTTDKNLDTLDQLTDL